MAKDESPNELSVDTTRMSLAPKIIVVAILSAFALVVPAHSKRSDLAHLF